MGIKSVSQRQQTLQNLKISSKQPYMGDIIIFLFLHNKNRHHHHSLVFALQIEYVGYCLYMSAGCVKFILHWKRMALSLVQS